MSGGYEDDEELEPGQAANSEDQFWYTGDGGNDVLASCAQVIGRGHCHWCGSVIATWTIVQGGDVPEVIEAITIGGSLQLLHGLWGTGVLASCARVLYNLITY